MICLSAPVTSGVCPSSHVRIATDTIASARSFPIVAAATLSLAAGAPVKVVQERLGHASAKMTLDVYAKAVPSIQRGAADQMAGILGDWVTFGVKSEGAEKKNTVK